MFDNVGNKLRSVAKIFCWIGIALSVLMAIAMLVAGNVVGALVALAAGALASWLGSLTLYGFGELIELTRENAAFNKKLLEVYAQINAPASLRRTQPVDSADDIQSNYHAVIR